MVEPFREPACLDLGNRHPEYDHNERKKDGQNTKVAAFAAHMNFMIFVHHQPPNGSAASITKTEKCAKR